MSTRWPHSSWSEFHQEAHCWDLKNKSGIRLRLLSGLICGVGWVGGGHTLFGNVLRGNSNFKWGEHRGVVTCHDVISAPCKFTQTLINTSVHILHILSLKGRLSCSFTSIFGHFCVQGFFSYFLSAKQNVKTKEEEREGHREWTLEQWKSDSDQSKIRGSERCRGSK